VTGARAVADALAAEGTEVVFGVLGDGNMHMVAHLVEDHGARYVATRHEAAAVAMADGYARSTGRPGVATVTQGPGLTNAATALTEARRARSPVLLLSGETARGFHDHIQDIDQQPFALATAGAYQAVGTPASLAKDVGDAFRHVRLGLGPTVLAVPTDLQRDEMPPDWSYPPADVVAPQRVPPDPAALAAAAELVAAAERPIVIAGRGAVLSGAREELLALAGRIGAPVATSLQAKGWFRDDPFDLGIAGGFSHEPAREVFAQADLVVAFGAALNRFTASHNGLFPQAKVVQVALERGSVGHTVRVDAAVLADARLTAAALLDAGPERTGLRTPALAQRLAGFERYPEFTEGNGVDPRQAAAICDRLLPADRCMLLGTGHFNGYPAVEVGVPDPRDLVLPWAFGSVGVALPTALGVSLARPDRTVVVFEGDGGLMMSLPELETAARERIPVVVVVLDDGAYGAETYMMEKAGLDPALSLFDNPDLAEVARVLGARGLEATTAEELEAALADLGPVDGPVLVRVRVDRSVWNEEVFRTLTG